MIKNFFMLTALRFFQNRRRRRRGKNGPPDNDLDSFTAELELVCTSFFLWFTGRQQSGEAQNKKWLLKRFRLEFLSFSGSREREE